MMWANLFWLWGHPEVYIVVLPAFGMFSEVIATFSRKRFLDINQWFGPLLQLHF